MAWRHETPRDDAEGDTDLPCLALCAEVAGCCSASVQSSRGSAWTLLVINKRLRERWHDPKALPGWRESTPTTSITQVVDSGWRFRLRIDLSSGRLMDTWRFIGSPKCHGNPPDPARQRYTHLIRQQRDAGHQGSRLPRPPDL